ncbi:MAG: UvrD-helicase domain-containing protein [Pirellulaceae bacterium]|nr:UvrD-helicase domain-containing protein [Pirellulaceae bacterium]
MSDKAAKNRADQLDLFGVDDDVQGADRTSITDINSSLHETGGDDGAVALMGETSTGDALASRLVRASAGTGKTYQLTARLLKILLQGVPCESILATTFTRKAAGEILNRLLLALADAADEQNDQALEKLREQVGIENLSRKVCVNLLDTLLRNIHRLRICTLDSLFAQLARSFPFELGLPPTWRLTDEIEEGWLRRQAIESMISSLDPAETMTLLSMLSKGDVKRSIASELTQVIDQAYTVQRQCTVDVWNKLQSPQRPESPDLTRAAGMMRQAQAPQKTVRAKLDKCADSLELRDFKPLTDDTLIINIAKARRTKSEVKLGRSKLPEGLDEALDVLYKAVRCESLSLLQAKNEATGTVLSTYDYHITQLKQRIRALGFEDVAVRLANEFRSFDHQSLTNRMDGAIDHVLLDEFQDTSPVQWQVLFPLAKRAATPETEASGADDWRIKRSFFCVGDTKQAIYGWRGGVAEIFDAVAQQIDDVEEVQQNKSYRSSPVILDVVDRTFKNLQRHPLAALPTPRDATQKATYVADAIIRFARRFPEHQSAKKTLPGYVRYETARKVDGTADEQRRACLEHAARLIQGLNQESPGRKIGVLTRTNKTVAALIFLLDSMGVEVSQEGGNPLIDSAAVDLILSTLMCAEHPGDGRWLFHVMGSPLAGELGADPGEFVRRMIDDRGLSETVEYLAGVVAPHCDNRDTLRLRQLTQLAMTYQRNAAPRLRDFVQMVREKKIERPQSAHVRVMTVHQAKGLEFDIVVLPEVDGNLIRPSSASVADVGQLGEPPNAMTRSINEKEWHFLPTSWQRAFGEQVSAQTTEALCLLYVAMTRAKQGLYIVIPPSSKEKFENKTPASMIFHALQCEADPSQGETLLFEHGDPNYLASDGDDRVDEQQPIRANVSKSIVFRSLPKVPRRNQSADIQSLT